MIPEGLSIAYVECPGREYETNLDVTAISDVATAIRGTFVHFVADDCDSHRGQKTAQSLIDLDADLYLVGISTRTFLQGSFSDRNTGYPVGLDDHRRIFLPLIIPDAPPDVGDRQLSAFETWLVLDQALRARLTSDRNDWSGGNLQQAGITTAQPDDRTDFEETILTNWRG